MLNAPGDGESAEIIAEAGFPHLQMLRYAEDLKGAYNELKEKTKALRDLKVTLDRKDSYLREIHERLFSVEKIISVGELAAGIIHEIANAAQAVSGGVACLRIELGIVEEAIAASKEDPPRRISGQVAEYLDIIENGLSIISGMTSEVRAFVGNGNEKFVVSQVNTLLRMAVNLTHGRYKNRTVLRLDLGSLPEVEVRPHDLEQVFINLLLNAYQSIEDLDTDDPEANEVHVTSRLENDRIRIDFADTGVGVRPENRDRIFDKFFSTKGEGESMGLGLSIVKKTVEEHRGRIEVSNRPGRGSVFTVFLPI